MTIYRDSNSYIAEEHRQILAAIEATQRRLSREIGCEVAFDAAKRHFLNHEFAAFAVDFRTSHRVRNDAA